MKNSSSSADDAAWCQKAAAKTGPKDNGPGRKPDSYTRSRNNPRAARPPPGGTGFAG